MNPSIAFFLHLVTLALQSPAAALAAKALLEWLGGQLKAKHPELSATIDAAIKEVEVFSVSPPTAS